MDPLHQDHALSHCREGGRLPFQFWEKQFPTSFSVSRAKTEPVVTSFTLLPCSLPWEARPVSWACHLCSHSLLCSEVLYAWPCYYHLEILRNFWIRAPIFHFSRDPTNYVTTLAQKLFPEVYGKTVPDPLPDWSHTPPILVVPYQLQ